MSTTESKLRLNLQWTAAALQGLVPASKQHGRILMLDTQEQRTIAEILDAADAALALPASSGAEPHPDEARIDYLEELRMQARQSSYSWDTWKFTTDIPVRPQIDTALAQAEAAKGAA